MGFLHVEHSGLVKQLDVGLDEKGNIRTDRNYMTTNRGVFAAGDAVTGASLVVKGIDHGQRAAAAISLYLESL